MQLNRKTPLKGALATFAAALLGTASGQAQPVNRVESSFLLYSESDRVSAFEGVFDIKKQLRGELGLDLKLTYDALTGASPNGATPAQRVQTFTRPSGSGQYTIAPGKIPLDDTFHDTRFSFGIGLSDRIGSTTAAALGGQFSNEYDYVSYGVNGTLARDFNRKNTTIGISGAYSRDRIRPEGSIPIPLGSMAGPGETQPRLRGTDNKNVYDLVFNVSQVLNRSTVARMNYSFSRSEGYMTDPFKILSVVEGPAAPEAGEPTDYVFESRPRSRSKHALYGQVRHYFTGNTVDFAYRYFWDNWGVRSHTVEAFYRWQFKSGRAIEPHLRWYHQTAADFYKWFLVSGQELPQYASADYRLANFDAVTTGVQFVLPIGGLMQARFGAEYYIQRGDSSPPEAFGTLRDYELFPQMDAFMLRVGFERGL